MNKYIYKLGTAATIAGFLATSFAPAVLAETTVDISGNGSGSINNVNVTNVCTVTVLQKNKTYVSVNATLNATTGGNEANNNTGGDVTIDTGNAASSLDVTVGGSSNTAEMPNCCECANGATDVTVSDNGSGSINNSNTTNVNTKSATQKNKSKTRVKATLKSKTGKNKANNNTNGTVNATSGNASSTLNVTVDPSTNNL